ncbi:carboxypeptidase-like regulatory domain-containing protein [Rufibacter sp. XAAS-G3-1]|uniref:carboxypeptidase-like regulatory domain-containing protein n=1 Tax=Rufibacter sp. XAAS-G3-1 TaxID=2729134 RepID=UPI0015E6CF79|nr:carboxypeptidase-like regulatory domain-containing protein [Rufibacter sp. XAAS-G3-1]
MPTRRLTVSVPQPCHEDWNAMTPAFQGRFCQNCSKTVVDFTAMSDAEVVNWLEKADSRVCARLRSDQQEKEMRGVPTARQRWTWQAFALGMAAWLSVKTAEAKESTSFPALEQGSQAMKNKTFAKIALPLTIDSSRIVKGVVLDVSTKGHIPGVTVFLKGTAIAASTDKDGKFTLPIPDTFPENELNLIFSHIGYLYQEIHLKDLPKHGNIIVRLFSNTSNTISIGEVMVTGFDSPKREFKSAPPASKKTGLIQRIKSLFS